MSVLRAKTIPGGWQTAAGAVLVGLPTAAAVAEVSRAGLSQETLLLGSAAALSGVAGGMLLRESEAALRALLLALLVLTSAAAAIVVAAFVFTGLGALGQPHVHASLAFVALLVAPLIPALDLDYRRREAWYQLPAFGILVFWLIAAGTVLVQVLAALAGPAGG